MANVALKNPKQYSNSKKLSRKRSFKLGLIPMLCSNSDASSPCHSSSTSTGRSRLAELQKVFRHLDSDRDGKISGHELSTFFSAMGDEELRSDEVFTIFFISQRFLNQLGKGFFLLLTHTHTHTQHKHTHNTTHNTQHTQYTHTHHTPHTHTHTLLMNMVKKEKKKKKS